MKNSSANADHDAAPRPKASSSGAAGGRHAANRQRPWSLRAWVLIGAIAAAVVLALVSPQQPSGERVALLLALVLLPALAVMAWQAQRRLGAANAELERRAAERAEEAALLTAALDVTATMAREADGTIRRWTDGCERLYGYTKDEALGRVSHALLQTTFPEGGLAAAEAALARCGEWRGDLRHVRKDGAEVVANSHWVRRDAGTAGRPGQATVVEFNTDATALRSAQASLRRREAEFRTAFEYAPAAIAHADPATGRLLRVNAAWCALLGRPDRELVGRPPWELAHPDDSAAWRASFERVRRGDVSVHHAVTRYVRRDGTVRWGDTTAALARDDEGRPVLLVVAALDVTERRGEATRQAVAMLQLEHRAKGLFAVVRSVLRLADQSGGGAFARAAEERVAAAERAHALTAEARPRGIGLRTLVEAELAAFEPGAAHGGESGAAHGEPRSGSTPRIEIGGPTVVLGPAAVQALSMALRELAVGALTHGALSAPAGRIGVSWRVDRQAGVLRLRWAEGGRPRTADTSSSRLLSSRLIETLMRDGLGGRVEQRWEGTALACYMEMPLHRVQAGAASSEAA
jgi:PAS domain S-box-containing protein